MFAPRIDRAECNCQILASPDWAVSEKRPQLSTYFSKRAMPRFGHVTHRNKTTSLFDHLVAAGGVVQGIGGALYEHFVYDEHGNPQTTTFLDYLLPTASEVPDLEYDHIETPSERPGGFKGMGEGGAIGAPAAVVNAVADALPAPLGVKLTRQPLTPGRARRGNGGGSGAWVTRLV